MKERKSYMKPLIYAQDIVISSYCCYKNRYLINYLYKHDTLRKKSKYILVDTYLRLDLSKKEFLAFLTNQLSFRELINSYKYVPVLYQINYSYKGWVDKPLSDISKWLPNEHIYYKDLSLLQDPEQDTLITDLINTLRKK